MTKDHLIATAQRLIKRYGTRDPFQIADALGIIVTDCPGFGKLKGMYSIIKRNRYIFLNDGLDPDTRRIVCAHEIGHDQLHRHLLQNGIIQEFTLYDMKSKPEYEANIICAELLLDTDEVLSYIYDDHYTVDEIACIMHTDINLVALKVAHLTAIGYKLNSPDYHSNFLQ